MAPSGCCAGEGCRQPAGLLLQTVHPSTACRKLSLSYSSTAGCPLRCSALGSLASSAWQLVLEAHRRFEMAAARRLKAALEDTSSGGGRPPACFAHPRIMLAPGMHGWAGRACSSLPPHKRPWLPPPPPADSVRLRAFAAAAVGPLRRAILKFYAQVGVRRAQAPCALCLAARSLVRSLRRAHLQVCRLPSCPCLPPPGLQPLLPPAVREGQRQV